MSHPPPLRLYSEDSDHLTLRAAFEQYLLPDQDENSPGTLAAYRQALTHWEKHTSNPDVRRIDSDQLRDWKSAFRQAGASPALIGKAWRHLRAILRRIGPPQAGNPHGSGLIDRVPYVRLPRVPTKIPRVVSHEELDRLYEACHVAKWPPSRQTGLSAATLFRAALVLAYNYGPRTQDLWSLPWTAVHWIDRRLCFVARKTAKLQGLPFNAAVEAALRSIHRPQRATLFHPTRCNSQFYREWAAINLAAGVEPVEWRDLRETCVSNYEKIAPGVGRWVVGHAARGVTETYYLNPAPAVLEAVNRLPQPAAFLRTSVSARQRVLFP